MNAPHHAPLIQPPRVLLLGGPGSGKTYSLSTLLEAGLEVFVIITEPVGLDTLIDVVTAKKLPIAKLHWHSITPSRPGFDSLKDMAKKVAMMDYEAVSKLRPASNRTHAQWIKVLECLSNFTCQRDGKSYGPVDQFSSDRVVVVDSLSGLNVMAMDITIGDKPTAHQGEWGIAMQQLEKLILALTSIPSCPFVLTAHTEREVNEITGVTQVMASALGRKLAPKLPRFFSEVVLAYREGEQFWWSTTATGVDLKNRALPLNAKLQPSFVPIFEVYRKRLAATAISDYSI